LSWNNENYINDRAPINVFSILGLEDLNKIVLAGNRIINAQQIIDKVNISARLLSSEVRTSLQIIQLML
jgi:ribosomal protein L18E